MIQRTAARIEARDPDIEGASWQSLLARSITDPATLLQRLGLDSSLLEEGSRVGHAAFPVRVPEPWLARIRYGDPDDPLLRRYCRWPMRARSAPALSPIPCRKPMPPPHRALSASIAAVPC
mgnify:CR=1 FL=1